MASGISTSIVLADTLSASAASDALGWIAPPKGSTTGSPLEYSLAKATEGQWVRLGRITDEAIQLLAMRLGLSEGALLRIKAKLPAGPLVVVCGQTELALGRELCHAIPVHPLE